MSNLKHKAMDDCARISHSIGVYVDGELDPAHAIELEGHVLACSTCSERIATLQAMRKSLKRTSAPRCPDLLRARLAATIERERQQQAGRAAEDGIGPKLIRLRYAVGLAAAAGVVFAMGMSRQAPPSSTPGHKPDAAVYTNGFDILDDLVSLHANPLPPETTNPDELPRLDPLVGVPVRRPPFQPFGASFNGARVNSMRDRRAALLQYTFRGGHRVTVYVFNPRVVEVKAMPLQERVVRQRAVYVGNVRGYSIAAAEQSGVGYALASDLSADQSTEAVLAAFPQ
jgi:anti-sigma factor RsiW